MNGIELIAQERLEQLTKHGRTVEEDVKVNANGQLAHAAMMLLAVDFEEGIDSASFPQGWGHVTCEKMIAKDYPQRLSIAGALIAAELDRINAISASCP